MNAVRGFVPDDVRNFSQQALEVLKKASADVLYLVEHGYGAERAAAFVGDHYQLSSRQRLAVVRSTATAAQVEERESKRLDASELAGRTVNVDGFNIIITLEVMECGSPLFECMDGAIRDLAALRGTYRIIPETRVAVKRMLGALSDAGAAGACVLLDEPVSNSGRLKALIADTAEETDFPGTLDIEVCRSVDKRLFGKECVITSDSVILDRCVSWFDLAGVCLSGTSAKTIRVW
jgi:hypothetical protein